MHGQSIDGRSRRSDRSMLLALKVLVIAWFAMSILLVCLAARGRRVEQIPPARPQGRVGIRPIPSTAERALTAVILPLKSACDGGHKWA